MPAACDEVNEGWGEESRTRTVPSLPQPRDITSTSSPGRYTGSREFGAPPSHATRNCRTFIRQFLNAKPPARKSKEGDRTRIDTRPLSRRAGGIVESVSFLIQSSGGFAVSGLPDRQARQAAAHSGWEPLEGLPRHAHARLPLRGQHRPCEAVSVQLSAFSLNLPGR